MSRRLLALTALLVLLITACIPQPVPTSSPTATAAAGQTPTPQPANTPSATPAPDMADVDAYPWWNQSVFYEVFVRSYADSSSGPLSCDGVGDINGLIERLDYLNDGDPNTNSDLGITGIWLMPIMQSPSYHGYDVVDYMTVDDEYGSNEDFRRLIDAAHQRGIRVIIDLVMNHTSSQHPWFLDATNPDSPYRNYYLWAETQPDFAGPWQQDVWHFAGRNNYYYGLFWSGMPDLNYREPAVTDKMYAIVDFWLNDMGVDGFRLDAIKYLAENGEVFTGEADTRQRLENTELTHAWLRAFHDHYTDINPQALTVGEVWDDTDTVLGYIPDQLDIAFQFELAEAIIESVQTEERLHVAGYNASSYQRFPPLQYATFLTNHDQNRIMDVLNGDLAKARVAAAIYLTSPGVPFVYYGEEIGMTGQKPDEKIRTPLQWDESKYTGFSDCAPWQLMNSDYETVNIAAQADDPGSLLSLYRGLIHLRNANPALMVGDYIGVQSDDSAIYAYLRQSPSQTVLVLHNLSDRVIDDYALETNSSGLDALRSGALLFPARGPASVPGLQADGGFSGYRPLPALAPHTSYVIQLAP